MRDIKLIKGIDWGVPLDSALTLLVNWVEWRDRIHGNWIPRLAAYLDIDQNYYSVSGNECNPIVLDLIKKLRDKAQEHCDATFDRALLNYYRSEADWMEFHYDRDAREPDQVQRKPIASLSLGEPRGYVMRRRSDPTITETIMLEAGDLLVIGARVHKLWEHGVMPEPHPCGPRVNLTLR